jgi:parallel beta-helix repeat protein
MKQEEAGIKVLSNNNKISGNVINNNFNGILVSRAIGNRIFSNIVKGNLGYGIKLLEANNNSVYGNILMDNYGLNAFDNGINKWDNNTIGNYFSDFDSFDEGCFNENKDALCDSQHAILGGQGVDGYPLARIFEL